MCCSNQWPRVRRSWPRDVGGTPEALVDGDERVCSSPRRSRRPWPPRLSQLIDNRRWRARLGRAARRRTISDRFSLDRMVAATETLYDDLLSRKHDGMAVAA